MSFEGKIAVVTGAGSGIGAGISEGIAKRGGKVYVTDLRLDLNLSGNCRKAK